MAEWCRSRGVAVWAYCLMPNHVHLIAVPETAAALRAAIGEAHRRYTRMVNFREGWRGHLWQGRFASFPMDGTHLLHCARYVELNPVRAGLVEAPEAWPYSSAGAHLGGRDDGLAAVRPLLELAGDWRTFLGHGDTTDVATDLRRHEATGRPLGDESFVSHLEALLARQLRRRKPGPQTPALRPSAGESSPTPPPTPR
jgi:putative transposase